MRNGFVGMTTDVTSFTLGKNEATWKLVPLDC